MASRLVVASGVIQNFRGRRASPAVLPSTINYGLRRLPAGR